MFLRGEIQTAIFTHSIVVLQCEETQQMCQSKTIIVSALSSYMASLTGKIQRLQYHELKLSSVT